MSLTKKLKRRQFLKGAAVVGAGVGTSAIVTPAISQGKVEWRMVTTWPKNFPGQGTGAVRFAESVGRATDGRLTIKVFAAGEIVPPFESFDAITRGAADCMHATPYYWPNKSKGLMFFSTVPFGLTTSEQEAWMQFGGGQELWDKIYDGFGLIGWHAGSTGVQMGGWFNKEITTVDSVKGMKMRIPGLGGEALKKLGMTVVNLPGGEIFAALQSGAIDATEWVGPYNDLAFGFYKVAKFYYWPGMHEPGTQIEFTADKKKFLALPKDVQDILRACIARENVTFTAEFNARNGQALETLIKTHNVTLKRFPNEFLTAYGAAAGEVIQELRDTGDANTKAVVESFLKARRELLAWNRIAEQGFLNARLLDYKFPG
ncbi:MAG TPA: TRAP transporter substrate-binding protein [Hyphomicrobiaceae bacterium]|nr:TRAP transporter substrate-binding protein [Hyphomicrobiaceae bacterium]